MIRPLALSAFALLLVAGCGQPEVPTPIEEPVAEAAGEPGVALDAEAKKLGGIAVETAAVHALQSTLEVPGTVAVPSDARAVVTSAVAGKVVRLLTTLGDRVAKGQALAEIQSGDLAEAEAAIARAETEATRAEAEVRQAAAAVDLARGRLRTSEANLERQKRFAKAGAFSQPSLTAAQNALNEALGEQATTKSELAGAQTRLVRAERLLKEGIIPRAEAEQARLDVQQAEIRQERADRSVELARKTLDRETRIGSQGLLNSREIQSAEAEVRAAKLEWDQARVAQQGTVAARQGAVRAIGNARAAARALRGGNAGGGSTLTLTAPLAGTVTERKATLGQAIERASDLFDIENTATVWVTANVPERDVSWIRPGVSVTVVTQAFPDRRFAGKVRLVGTRLDPSSRTLPVQCEVPNPEGLLRADLFARVRIAVGEKVSALAVPLSALSGEGDEAAVFVEKDGRFERRPVRTGKTDGQRIEITEGLRAGERVATSGVFTLQSELRKDELKEEE